MDLLNDVLKKIPSKELAKAARISERAIRSIRNGHSLPSSCRAISTRRTAIFFLARPINDFVCFRHRDTMVALQIVTLSLCH